MKKSKKWVTQKANLEYVPSGIIDLVITNEGEGAVSVDWVKFVNSNNDKDKEIEEDSGEVEAEVDDEIDEEVIAEIEDETDSASEEE